MSLVIRVLFICIYIEGNVLLGTVDKRKQLNRTETETEMNGKLYRNAMINKSCIMTKLTSSRKWFM